MGHNPVRLLKTLSYPKHNEKETVKTSADKKEKVRYNEGNK